MITKIVIKGFQKHQSKVIELEPEVTTITGPNGSGKSSILRALKWALINKPSGDSCIHWDNDAVSVRIHIDGKIIKRFRSKRKNTYKLDNQVFAALGASGVPEVIESLVNVSSINFQGQHDPSFWFFNTPGEVAKELNKIVNLDLIDRVLGNISSQVRKTKTLVEVSEDRLNDSIKKTEELSWTMDADRDLRVIEDKEILIEKKTHRIDSETRLIQNVHSLIQQRKNAVETKKTGENLLSLAEEIIQRERRLEKLCQTIENIKRTKVETRELQNKLIHQERELEKALKEKCPLCGRETIE